MPIVGNQNILWFQVPIFNFQDLVAVLYTQNHLRENKFSLILCKTSVLPQKPVQVSMG